MGNMCCGAGDAEMLARQELLKEGSDFTKKSAFLGLLSRNEAIYLQLNPSATRLLWRQTPGPSKAEELPVHRIGKVCPSGRLEMVVLGQDGQKLLELTAETVGVRDLWVQTLEELCAPGRRERSEADAKGLRDELDKQTQRQKEKYWKDRTSEMEERRLDAEERKKKIGLVGMKYTALAMANK